MNRSRSLPLVVGLIIFSGCIIGLIVGNYHFVKKESNGGGFLIQRIGIRALVTDGTSPYSDSITTQIQDTVRSQASYVHGYPLSYTSPLYSGFIVFPFSVIENSVIAHTLWMTIQLIAIFLIILIGLQVTAWKPAWYIFLLFTLFTVLSYHVIIPWLDGGLSIWAALLLAFVFLAIYNKWYEVGGICLALSTIQPQMTVLVVIFTLLWGVSKKIKPLFIWFLTTFVFISILISFLVPDWVQQYLRMLFNFSNYFPPANLGVLFSNQWSGLGRQLGWLVTGVSAVLLIFEWYSAFKKEYSWFFWTACITMVISQWIGIPANPGNLVGLIIPLILVSAMLTGRWHRKGQWIAVLWALGLFLWEWAILNSNLNSLRPGMQLNLLIPFPLTLLIGLYWVKWWAIKPRRLLVEEFGSGETY